MKQILRDADIRDDLCMYLEEKYGKVRFFEELTMGKSRADIVVVTEGGLTGVEIKSDADTYERLARQVKDYDRFFDKNFVVVGTRHAHHIREHVPEYWGVITVEPEGDGLDFYLLREADSSPKVKLANQLSLLWRRELTALQKKNSLYRYPGKSKAYVKKYLLSNVKADVLKQQMIDVMYDRDYSVFMD